MRTGTFRALRKDCGRLLAVCLPFCKVRKSNVLRDLLGRLALARYMAAEEPSTFRGIRMARPDQYRAFVKTHCVERHENTKLFNSSGFFRPPWGLRLGLRPRC